MEGLWGFSAICVAMIPAYYIKVPDTLSKTTPKRLENAPDALIQMYSAPHLLVAILALILFLSLKKFSNVAVAQVNGFQLKITCLFVQIMELFLSNVD